MVLAAVRVVTTRNVVHAALYLVVVLGGVAGLYVLLAAEFVAWAQVLIYIGAILVLLLFGIMLTRAPLHASSELDNDQRWAAAIVSLGLVGLLVGLLADTFGRQRVRPAQVFGGGELADSIFNDFLVPFEVVSMLLLAALIGAVVLARRDD
ncbi:MAG: NADH-quinone oxidoreductase subunit J [Actinobacteria bacterium]|nr:NADH-quinone oxidoreductase subunit J [Actinomycetota bacterium]